ncbi:GNAT family N-acetyltransferase, partial [Staphylococcus hominis]|uniref:GNAT family N-acetyltransferase n=1 Tax=Staphylococcus hominis TaxID=1290 RepID=UPI00103901E5
WINSPELLVKWAGTDFNYPLDEEQLKEYIKYTNKENSSKISYKVIIEENNSKKSIGHIALNNIDFKNCSATLSKVLVGDPQMRGQGLGPKIIKKIWKKAFEDLGLHRIELGVVAFNKSAIKSYKKSGVIKEGEKRDFRKLNGEYYNLWQMSMLESEWS